MILTPTQLMEKMNDSDSGLNNDSFQSLIDFILAKPSLVARKAVSLTTAADTTLFAVPSGYDFRLYDLVIEGKTAISGGTGSILKVGITGTLNQLNETTGHTFTSAAATTLIPVGDRRKMSELYPLSNMNGSTKEKVASGATLIANVSASTAVVTAGEVYVEVYGMLFRTGQNTF